MLIFILFGVSICLNAVFIFTQASLRQGKIFQRVGRFSLVAGICVAIAATVLWCQKDSLIIIGAAALISVIGPLLLIAFFCLIISLCHWIWTGKWDT